MSDSLSQVTYFKLLKEYRSIQIENIFFLKLEYLSKWLCAAKLDPSDGGDGALLNYALARDYLILPLKHSSLRTQPFDQN